MAYSKNPNKVEVSDYPTNFSELHETSINYGVEEDFDKKEEASIKIEISTQPKNEETGFFSYRATYYSTVSKHASMTAEQILDGVIPKYWGRIHADYVRALNDFRMPTHAFPSKPIAIDEADDKTKSSKR